MGSFAFIHVNQQHHIFHICNNQLNLLLKALFLSKYLVHLIM